jgi:hypothetical protein
MKWYTVTWHDNEEGKILEHFAKKAEANKRKKELIKDGCEDISIYNESVKNTEELVCYLNAEYNHDNG